MARNTLIYGAVILFAANFFNRILGFIYQYLIMRFIGSEAYGLFHMVFPVYMTALVFTTAGIPLAISKLISEKVSLGQYNEAQKIFKIALFTLVFTGCAVSITLYSNIPFLTAKFFPDQRIVYVFKICIPSILIVSIASAFRGYFQGLQNMLPSALGQICEQIARVAFGFTLAYKLLERGVEWAAAGLALGMLIGEIVGLAVIYLQYLFKKLKFASAGTKPKTSLTQVLIQLFALSLPVTGSRLMSTGLSALDAVIIPKQLQIAGYSARSATSLFGQLSGTALTLLTFPSVFTFALATSLVPSISEAIVKNNFQAARSRCSDAIRLTIILGLPCVIVMAYYAQTLTTFFNSQDVTPVLRILAIGGLFAYLQQTTTGILQGLGKTYLPLVHSIISAFLRIPLLFYLTALPKWGLTGSALAYIVGFFCIAVMNIRAVLRYLDMAWDYKSFMLKPLAAGSAMLLTIHTFSSLVGKNLLQCLLISGLSFLIYCTLLFLIKGITANDLRKIPLFRRFV